MFYSVLHVQEDIGMFIGHYGVAMAAKRAAPACSLGTLIFAAQLLDVIWPIFLLLGWEHVRIAPGITKTSPLDFQDYPISHSLLAAVAWSMLAALGYLFLRRYVRGAVVIALAVLSHWLLDYLVHRPDLPLWPYGAKVGLGLWNSWIATVGLEVLFFGAGLLLYLRGMRAADAIGRYAFWSLIAFLFLGWVGSLFAGPPPSTTALAWGGIAMWITVPWGWWADRHRKLTASRCVES